MPCDERDIESRLEAMGRREVSVRMEMPAALAGAVAARAEGSVKPVVGRMPWGAVAAAVAVVAAAGWVVVVRPAVMPRGGDGRVARLVLPADALASIVGRYERGASIDSALGTPSVSGGGSERVERAADWRGALAE